MCWTLLGVTVPRLNKARSGPSGVHSTRRGGGGGGERVDTKATMLSTCRVEKDMGSGCFSEKVIEGNFELGVGTWKCAGAPWLSVPGPLVRPSDPA